jgi:predicted DNA-binding antitoxin AbrB/MazE fold protein
MRACSSPLKQTFACGTVIGMITVAEAVYEDGCLRFLEPLPLREHARVSVSISPLDDRSERDEWLAQSERRLRELWDNKADDVYNELLAP